jgi:DNA replication and repair protein RecF
MILTELKIHNLRNLKATSISLNSRFNLVIGPNGSGKTSILEALYLLSCGHSFRSREIISIITHGESTITVFAQAEKEQSISIQKSSTQPTQIKLNNQLCATTSQLAYALPSLIMYSDIFQIIDAGSSVRRSVLDWGLFHVKHEYLSVWKDYKKVLKQRNALLKSQSPYSHFIPWDKQLNELAIDLDSFRQTYFEQLEDMFHKVLAELTNTSCSIEYFKGWDKKNIGQQLASVLAQSFHSDKHKTYTQHGAHHADIIITTNQNKAKQSLSRGQQKIILIALKLAQARLLDQDCLYLIDDFSAELDTTHQNNLLTYLANYKGQFIITSTQEMDYKKLINDTSLQVFEIDKGVVKPA